jgi:FSR family fosmidomycin resistance protein-like MFS transporter
VKRRSLSLLSLGHLTVDVTAGALPAVLPFLQKEFNLSYFLVAVIATTYQVTSSVAQPIFGILSDRAAQRFLVPLGVLLAAGGFAALGVAPTYEILLVAIVLAGLGSAIFHPEATKSARFVAGEYHAMGLSFFTIGGNIGVALGPLVLTSLVAWRGLHGTSLYLIWGAVVTVIVAAIGPALARAESAHYARTTPSAADARPAAMRLLIAVVALRSVVYSGILIYVPLFAVNVLHHSATGNGPLLFAILGAGALATIVGAALADRLGSKQTTLVSFAFVAPLLAVYLLVPGMVGIGALVLAGAFLIGTTTITVIMAQEYMPHRLALASALVIGFTSGLGGLGIAALGKLADALGLLTVLWSLVGVSVVGTAAAAFLPSTVRAQVSKDAASESRNLARSVANP